MTIDEALATRWQIKGSTSIEKALHAAA